MTDHPQIARGDLKPDIVMTISDARQDADFSILTASDVRIVGEMEDAVIFDSTVDSITPAQDNKSAILRRAWATGDTDEAGVLWVRAIVSWPGAKPQSFPRTGPLRIDIGRSAGDA